MRFLKNWKSILSGIAIGIALTIISIMVYLLNPSQAGLLVHVINGDYSPHSPLHVEEYIINFSIETDIENETHYPVDFLSITVSGDIYTLTPDDIQSICLVQEFPGRFDIELPIKSRNYPPKLHYSAKTYRVEIVFSKQGLENIQRAIADMDDAHVAALTFAGVSLTPLMSKQRLAASLPLESPDQYPVRVLVWANEADLDFVQQLLGSLGHDGTLPDCPHNQY